MRRAEAVTPAKKFHVMIIDDTARSLEAHKDYLETYLDRDLYMVSASINSVRASDMADETGPVDFLVIDANIARAEKDKTYLNEIAAKAQAVVIFSGLGEDEASNIAGEVFSSDMLKKVRAIQKGDGLEHDDLLAAIKMAREEALRAADAASRQPVKASGEERVVPEVKKPDAPFRTLLVEDEAGIAMVLKMVWNDELSKSDYELVCAGSVERAIEKLSMGNFDAVIYDCKLPGFNDEFKRLLLAVPDLVVQTAAFHHQIKTILGDELFTRSRYLKKPYDILGLISMVKGFNEKRMAAAPKNRKKAPPVVKASKAQCVFVLDNNGNDAKRLSDFIKKRFGAGYNVSRYDMIYTMKVAIEDGLMPDIVIMNTVLKAERREDNEDMAFIIDLIKKHNPKARFIITSEEAAVMAPGDLESDNVIAIIEKPFHFHDVADALDGVYDHKVMLAGERFKIDETGRILKDLAKSADIGTQSVIKVWKGYAGAAGQKGMLTRIRKNTENSPYRVEFESDIMELMDFACENGGKSNIVTILPNSALTEGNRRRIKAAGAAVIFMDISPEEPFSDGDLLQVSAIIGTGIAYLNNNAAAFMRFYRLLTDDRSKDPVTIEEFMKDPTRLVFTLIPARIHDYEDLKRLNSKMEEVLIMA